MASLAPFLLSPVYSERPWGGVRLASFGKDLRPGALVGESWEVADLPDGVTTAIGDPRSRIASGPHLGLTLGDVIRSNESDLMGSSEPTPEGRFPLLVKLIDAREPLSIQVHPPAEFVASHPLARLKTESWYVVDAEPGGSLLLDFRDGIEAEDALAAVGSSSVVPMLDRVLAEVGSFHHVPAGLVHAIGAGVVIAEVQTPSDTTYRIYDWSEELGRAPRAMHPVEARQSIRLHPEGAFRLEPSATKGSRELIACDEYWIREHAGVEGIVARRQTGGPSVILTLRGSVAIDGLAVPMGRTAVIPASSRNVELEAVGGTTLLEIGLVG